MRWTDAMDSKLLTLVANGIGVRAAAREMGLSENAAIARHNRLRGVIFKSDRERGSLTKKERAEAVRQRANHEAEIISKMLKSIRSGTPRNQAIVRARKSGVRLRVIAEQFGICRERVRQIEAAA